MHPIQQRLYFLQKTPISARILSIVGVEGGYRTGLHRDKRIIGYVGQ
jgi:hypothetical protein